MGAIVIVRTGEERDNRVPLGKAFLAREPALHFWVPRVSGMATVPGGVQDVADR